MFILPFPVPSSPPSSDDDGMSQTTKIVLICTGVIAPFMLFGCCVLMCYVPACMRRLRARLAGMRAPTVENAPPGGIPIAAPRTPAAPDVIEWQV